MAKSAAASLAGGKFLHHLELHLHDRDHDQLSNALTGLDLKVNTASIPAGDHHLALVIGVNQAHQIAQNDPMLVPQTGTGQEHGCQPRIFDMQGKPRGDQLGITR